MKRLLRHLREDPKLPRVNLQRASELLGDLMPRIDASPVGRLRLVRALHQRFGDSWKNVDAAARVLADFDNEVAHIKEYVGVKRRTYG